MAASVHARVAPGAFGRIRLRMPRPDQLAPTDLVLAASSPDFPFDLLESSASRVVLAQRGRREPALVVDGAECLFALVPGWRKAVALLLLHRLMRCARTRSSSTPPRWRSAAAGVLLVGPKGAGKSTLALGPGGARPRPAGRRARLLPARRRGELLPFRRPVGVKPGPRAAAVRRRSTAAGARPGARRHDARPRGGPARRAPARRPAPLRAVVFLRGRSRRSRASCAVEPGRDGRWPRCSRWAARSLNAAPHAARLRDGAPARAVPGLPACRPGDPDDTAGLLEARACAHEPDRRRARAPHRHLPLRRGAAHGDRRRPGRRPRPRWR